MIPKPSFNMYIPRLFSQSLSIRHAPPARHASTTAITLTSSPLKTHSTSNDGTTNRPLASRSKRQKKKKAPEEYYPPKFGENIYVFSHLQTKQVVYSMKPVLKQSHALKQLTFHGKKTVPNALRRDLWRPMANINFSPSKITHRVGACTMQYLREFRKMHEYSWDWEEMRGLTKKTRGRRLMNQRDNSVADMAAALKMALPKMPKSVLAKEGVAEEKAKTASTVAEEEKPSEEKKSHYVYLSGLEASYTEDQIFTILEQAKTPKPTAVRIYPNRVCLVFESSEDAQLVWTELQGEKGKYFATTTTSDLDVRYPREQGDTRSDHIRLFLAGVPRFYTKETFLRDYATLNLPTPKFVALHTGSHQKHSYLGFETVEEQAEALRGLRNVPADTFGKGRRLQAGKARTPTSVAEKADKEALDAWVEVDAIIKWVDILDAEIAEEWPELVSHDVWVPDLRRGFGASVEADEKEENNITDDVVEEDDSATGKKLVL